MLTFLTALLLSSLSLHATDNVYLQIYYFCADKHGDDKEKLNDEKAVAFATA